MNFAPEGLKGIYGIDFVIARFRYQQTKIAKRFDGIDQKILRKVADKVVDRAKINVIYIRKSTHDCCLGGQE